MEVVLKRGTKDGIDFHQFEIDEQIVSDLELAKVLVHSKISANLAAWNTIYVKFGNVDHTFVVKPIDLLKTSENEIEIELRKRINLLRDWIDTIDKDETLYLYL